MCVHGTRRRLHSCTHCECLGSKEEFSEFLTASQFLLSKKTWRLYYRKKRSFGSNWTYSPSKTFMSVTLICLLSSFPIIFISCKTERLSLPLFRFRTLQQFKKKKKKKRRFTSIRFSLLQKNSALRANARGVETPAHLPRVTSHKTESKIK